MKRTPAPQNTTAQRIEKLEFTPRARLTTENRFGNRIAYWEVGTPPGSLDLKMYFVCTRREILVDLDQLKGKHSSTDHL